MVGDINSVYITVGSVVLDRPDQSGEFIAKDLAVGWAYIVADNEGDKRFRGQGSCAGGLATGLRYALMSAVGCVPNYGPITIYVETAQAHRQMVQLATGDVQVVAAIAGRPVFVMTRPRERSSLQVRLAAERAATAALRVREHIERQETVEPSALDPVEAAEAEPVVTAPTMTPESRQSWRRRVSRPSAPGQLAIRAAARSASRQAPATEPTPSPRASSGVRSAAPPQTPLPRARVLTQWMHEFDSRVESVQTGLQSVSW